ncbi:MAG: hypothetical protein IPM79_35660 [Polyangiaceae bacterium]|nr:hypothetical protein [Polyangiaceae bacterium]MBK8942796.1 hypothetical protein [Polyangiaceae bacterium]
MEQRQLADGGGGGQGGQTNGSGGSPSGGGGEGGCGLLSCEGDCVDTLDSNDHCGRCDNACPEGLECLAGVCDRRLRGGRGSSTICARFDEAMVCWGGNERGQAGNGFPSANPSLTEATLPGGPLKFAASAPSSTCFLSQVGSVECFGANWDGELGTNAPGGPDDVSGEIDCCFIEEAGVPNLPGQTAVADVVAGGFANTKEAFFCFRLASGDVYCSGDGAPAPIFKIADTVQLEAGTSYACALNRQGEVWCWGATWGAGDYNTVAVHVPYKVEGLPAIRAIGSARTAAFAVAQDGELWAWGSNDWGLLGPGAQLEQDYYPPRRFDHRFEAEIAQIDGGDQSACALLVNGSVACWGANGLQGDGTPTSGLDPSPHTAQVADVVELASSLEEHVVRLSDGSFLQWSKQQLQPAEVTLP